MTLLSQIWGKLDRAARFGLALFLALLAAAIIAASVWLLRADYQVLFGDLAPTDAAAMTAELDRMKVPYKLDNGGNTILVPAEQVYKTRLKLIGRDLPLHGTVGFELFNNTDLGMTEFAQKVNYQRALQGELTRTILSYEEIQAARVHLALPEEGLFKKANVQAKASVSLTLKPGMILQPREVQGIQRLIAASVPEIREEDVTVIDQHGVALTHTSTGDDNASSGDLDSKEAIEHYLTRKVADVLDRSFGVGQSIASVDVVFNRDSVKTTTENVLGANENSPVGVIVHEHQTGHDAPASSPTADTIPSTPPHPAAGNTVREVDYQVGRRVKQVVSTPGGIERISIAVVVRQSLEVDQIDRIKDIVSMAAGINKERGDAVAVYTMPQFGAAQNAMLPPAYNPAREQGALDKPLPPAKLEPATQQTQHSASLPVVAWILGGLFLAGALVIILIRGTKPPAPMSQSEREEVLARVRGWLDSESNKQGGGA